METKNDDELNVDLLMILNEIFHKLWLVIIVGVVCSLVVIVYSMVRITPTYQSTTKMYILSKQNQESLTSGDLQVSSLLVKDYIEVIKSRTVIDKVIFELGMDMSYEQLLSKIDISAASDTRVITINVSDKDPVQARNIANELCDISSNQLKDVMNLEAVNVVDKANMPKAPSSPNIKRNGILAGLFGVALTSLIIALRCILDDTIKNANDVDLYLELGTLGTIPVSKSELEHEKHRKSRKKRSDRRASL